MDLRELTRKASGESLDLKPYEADMRHLIDMYIEAAEARKVSPWENMTLLDLIVKSGIAEAMAYEEYLKRIAHVARQVERGMSNGLSPDLDTPGKRALFNNLMLQTSDSGAEAAHEPGTLLGAAAIGTALATALALDAAVKAARPDNWRDNGGPRERMVKKALHDVLGNAAEVERLFVVVKGQKEY